MNILLFLSTAFAEPTPTGQVTSAISYNRLGVSLVGQYGTHIPMWEKEGNALFQNTGIDIVGEVNTTPAFTRTGMRVTVLPIAVLKLQGFANASYYFGNFQTLVGYDTLGENYGTNSEMADYSDSTGRQYSGMGWTAGGSATLQAKVGNIVFSNTTGYSTWNITTPDGENGVGVFEREKEIMVALENDTVLENNTLLLYQIDQETDKFLRIGNLTTYRHSMTADDTLFRTGLLFVAQKNPNKSHIVIAQSYIQDRAFNSPIVPYVAYAYKYTL